MTREKLLEYCKEHGILVPPSAKLEQIHAAIVRAKYHDAPSPKAKSCFGFWEHENSTCLLCDFKGDCFKASLGVGEEEYFKRLEALENPKIRFTERKSK